MSEIKTLDFGDTTYIVRIHPPSGSMGVMHDFIKLKADIEAAFFNEKLVCKILSRTSPQREDGTTGKPLGNTRTLDAHFRNQPKHSASALAMKVAEMNGFFELPSTLTKTPKTTETEENTVTDDP